jgi:hypothetical protein
MSALPAEKTILIAFLICLVAPVSRVWAADHKLLSLVPPGAQDVAKIGASSIQDRSSNLVFITHDSRIDLSDVFALAGADSKLVIHEIIVAGAGDGTGKLNQHSILAGGSFDQARIYRSALENGARVDHYHGESVMVVPPFARERGEFNEVRLLAIPDSEVLLFGSIVAVQEEIDRHLRHSTPDPGLLSKLRHMRRDDETWSLLSGPDWNSELRTALASIDPNLAGMLRNGDLFQFGIRYGRHIEFEYEVTTPSSKTACAISDSLAHSLVGPTTPAFFLASRRITSDDSTVRGVIKVSMNRYRTWLQEISARGRRHCH